MKKIVLLISLVILLSSCWNKTEEIVEDVVNTGTVEAEVMPEENIVITGATDEAFDGEEKILKEEIQKETQEEDQVEIKKEKTPTQPKVVEEKKVETKTPVVKTEEVKKEKTTPAKVADHEPTTPVADEGTEELIDDMIGDIDDIFKEIESEG